MTELKECPFCGGTGDIESQPSYSQAANTYTRYRGWCDQCGFGLDWHGHETDAITAWNTRAPTPAADEAVALLEKMLKWDGSFALPEDREAARAAIVSMQARSAEPSKEGEGE